MSNAGFNSNEPVIGDAFDLETYGRPSTQRHAARAHRPERVTSYSRRPASPVAAPVASAPIERESIVEADVRSENIRTVKIKGQTTPARRRAAVQIERYDRRPDRAAQWALFMGVFMIVVAIVTGT